MKRMAFRDWEYSICRKSDLSAYIRSAGHFLLKETDQSSWNTSASFCELFWCIEGKGRFELDGRSYLLHPNEVWYYPLGSHHKFTPADKIFHYRWFTIEGAMASALFTVTGIKPGVSYGGKCPENLFAQLELLIRQSSSTVYLDQLSVGFQILCQAASGIKRKKKEHNYVQEARKIIDQDFANPDLNIKSLAMILHVNRVQLSREFSHQFGVPVSVYLRSLRMQKGMDLLKKSSLRVEEIAEACGYNSADYFGKVITGITGKNPTKHRVLNPFYKKKKI